MQQVFSSYNELSNYEIRTYYGGDTYSTFRFYVRRKALRTWTVSSRIPPISTITPTRVGTIIVHTGGTLWTVVTEAFAFVVIWSEKKNTSIIIVLYIGNENK